MVSWVQKNVRKKVKKKEDLFGKRKENQNKIKLFRFLKAKEKKRERKRTWCIRKEAKSDKERERIIRREETPSCVALVRRGEEKKRRNLETQMENERRREKQRKREKRRKRKEERECTRTYRVSTGVVSLLFYFCWVNFI